MDLQCTLMDHAVLQRNSNNVSEHSFKGLTETAGKLLLTVSKDGNIFAGFDGVEIGSANRGKLTGCIKGLPTGGPYKLELQIAGSREKITVKDVLVGDLWLLGGQSNMADSGFMPSLTEKNDMVHAFYMNNNWDIAEDPLHDVGHAAAPVHGGNPSNPYPRKRLRGTGPGTSFGVEMFKATGVPQGLIACAHGGTSLEQWDPAKKKMGGYSLYGALYGRLEMLGGKVAGLVWYQGCNESGSAEKAAAYDRNTRKIFAAVRRDCKDPDLPIVLAQLGPQISTAAEKSICEKNWMTIRCAQYKIGQTLKNCACVPTIDLELDDLVHLSNRAVNILGKRFAAAMLQLRGKKEILPPIALAKVKCSSDPVTQNALLKIEFKNVQGKLVSGSNPCGFSVLDADNNFYCDVIRTRLEGNAVLLQTRVPAIFFSRDYRIAYGALLQPHANITDEGGRSLPCFIASAPKLNARLTDMVKHALISEAVFTDDSYAALKLPENHEQLKYTPAPFQSFYMPAPRPAEYTTEHKVFVYKFRIRLVEDMSLNVLFGADASFLLYLDGKKFHHQCTSNPVVIDEFKLPVKLSAGVHEFACVFSSNGGCGWGICCRFKRLDGKILPEIVNICEAEK